MSEIAIRGTKKEQALFKDVYNHYQTARNDLEQRITRKNGFDDADRMFSSHLEEQKWPYRSTMFDPRPFQVVLEKSARLIGSKPKGRLTPREGGDTLGAYINNELLSFQWDDNARLGDSMIAKWIQMDQNARKYGAAFGLVKWKYERRKVKGKIKTFYDGNDFVVCNSRDVLANPSYDTVQKWFQHREFMTLDDLEMTNDISRTEPVYKNLDVLRDAMKEEAKSKSKGSSRREVIYTNENKSIRGLNDYLGTDEVFQTVELITEYRTDRWITFAPKYGVIVRDIKSPYDHGEIPVVMLRYYPLGDDLYGMSEYEPVSKMIRGNNALFSQYIDNITVDLYPPLMVNPTNVRMHTLEFTAEAKWLMNNPGVDVKRLETSTAATNNFQSANAIITASLLNAWGESSQGTSSTNPFTDQGRVTAAEIRDTAQVRNVRDNMNQIFLSEALKKQTMFWLSLNKQFMFKGGTSQARIIRIVGRDAAEFFKEKGLADISPTQEETEQIAMGLMSADDVLSGPRFPVQVGDEAVSKFQPDSNGGGGNLLIEPGDLMGEYDYVPDIESMKAPTTAETEKQLTTLLGTVTNPAIIQGLAQEGKRPKYTDLLVRMIEATDIIKDAEALFEDIPQSTINQQNAEAQQAGGAGPVPGGQGPANVQDPGLAGSLPPLAPGQNQAQLG